MAQTTLPPTRMPCAERARVAERWRTWSNLEWHGWAAQGHRRALGLVVCNANTSAHIGVSWRCRRSRRELGRLLGNEQPRRKAAMTPTRNAEPTTQASGSHGLFIVSRWCAWRIAECRLAGQWLALAGNEQNRACQWTCRDTTYFRGNA